MADRGKGPSTAAALKMAMTIVGIGAVMSATLVLGMDRIMKAVFVNEDWPESEWTNDDWAEEELEG